MVASKAVIHPDTWTQLLSDPCVVKSTVNLSAFGGMTIVTNPVMPKDKAVLLDGEGNVVSVLNLGKE